MCRKNGRSQRISLGNKNAICAGDIELKVRYMLQCIRQLLNMFIFFENITNCWSIFKQKDKVCQAAKTAKQFFEADNVEIKA